MLDELNATHVGLGLLAIGAVALLGGLARGARRTAVARSLLAAQVVAIPPAEAPVVAFTQGAFRGSQSRLEGATPALRVGDTVRLPPPGQPGSEARIAATPRSSYWVTAVLFGCYVGIVGAAIALGGGDGAFSPGGTSDSTLIVPVSFLLAGLLLSSLILSFVGRVAGLVRFIAAAERVPGKIAAYRTHPWLRIGGGAAPTGGWTNQARIEYTVNGSTRYSWSTSGYLTTLFTGKQVATWLDPRTPDRIMTIGTATYVVFPIALVGGTIGFYLVSRLALG